MKKALYVLAIVAIVFLSVDNGSAYPIQWAGNDHWYERIDLTVGISWDDAKAAAEVKGGYLATITSYEEDYFVINNLIIPVQGSFPNRPRNGDWFPYWIGGYQQFIDIEDYGYGEADKNWNWVTGETWDYTNWYGNEPNDAGGDYSPRDYYEDNAENFLTYWTETNMDSGILNYGWNDLRGDSGENRLGYFIEYDANPVPEPSTILLLGAGLAGVGLLRRRFKN